jgi:hypothetical protein
MSVTDLGLLHLECKSQEIEDSCDPETKLGMKLGMKLGLE